MDNYYASAYTTGEERQLSHRKTKLKQMQQNIRINLTYLTKEYRQAPNTK